MKTFIIGAGPASLMAASKAIKKGDEVLVFEKMKTAGRKFLVAGDGGFNLSHIGDFDEFVSYYSHPQMAGIIRQFTNDDLVQFLKELGIDTYVGSSGKIFPLKEIKPAMVLNTWLTYLKKQGVQFFYHAVLEDFDNEKVIIRSISGQETYTFDRLILGLGAASWPKTGSDAAWVSLFQSKNIQVIPFEPSNAGINVNLPKEFLHQFQGTVFKNVVVSHHGISRKGEVVLTEYGLEGAPIYYLNPSIRKEMQIPMYIDFKPSHSEDYILSSLIESKNISDGLKKLKLPKAFVFWCKQFLSKEEYNELVLISQLIKQFPIYMHSFRPIEEAISCAGGVAWDELNERLQLKKFPAVSVVGEMIDWEAPTGGYLLQSAFSMGFVAGN
jgi:uncharacterized flavoprotein (TIGR03862 family)